jgi:hypothetical protein
MKKLLWSLLILLLLLACSPAKRFNRLITKHPELLTTDSVVVHDTIRIVVPEVKVDTIVNVESLFDTIFLQQDQLKVKVWMDREKKVYIQGQCDTVYIDKVITRTIPIKYYEKPKVKTTFEAKLQHIVNGVFITFIILLLIYIIYRTFLKRI